MQHYNYELECLIDDVGEEHNYLSETKKDVINSVKGDYPQLCTYESEWIYYNDLESYTILKNEVIEFRLWYSFGLDYATFPIKSNTRYYVYWNLNYAPNRVGFLYYDNNGTAQFNGTIYNESFKTKDYVILTSGNVNNNEIIRFRFPNTTTNQPTGEIMVIEYQEGMENWDIPYFKGTKPFKIPPIPIYGEELITYTNFTTKTLNNALPRKLDTCKLYGETWKSGSTMLTIKNPTLKIQNADKSLTRTVKSNKSSALYLRGIGTYQDELDFVNLKVKRYIKPITVNDTANWVQRTDVGQGNYCYYINLEGQKIAKQNTIICNHPTLNVSDGCWSGAYLVVWTTTITSLSAFKEVVKANPITAHYVLATPTEESITSDEQALLFEGTNYITLSASNKTPQIKTLKYYKQVIIGYE